MDNAMNNACRCQRGPTSIATQVATAPSARSRIRRNEDDAPIYVYWPQVYAGTSGAPPLLKMALNWYAELWFL
jgi:hypothetical protein